MATGKPGGWKQRRGNRKMNQRKRKKTPKIEKERERKGELKVLDPDSEAYMALSGVSAYPYAKLRVQAGFQLSQFSASFALRRSS